MQLPVHDIGELMESANQIRQDIIRMLVEAKSGHSAGPLGTADIFTALYFNVMRIRPDEPNWEDRDRFVLSCGHICPVLYATMARVGYFSVEELKTLRKLGSRLQGHPHRGILPGLETTSGPLGSGLSQASGMAYVAKMDNKSWRTYVVMSDGEQEEGNTWEAVMFAGKYKLNNLTALMDRNFIQIDGSTEEVMPLESVKLKYEAFNWHVLEVDGNNIEAIINACREAQAISDRPTLIICYTVPGKGVDFMEGKFEWHGKPPNHDEAKEALHQLRTLQGQIRSEHE